MPDQVSSTIASEVNTSADVARLRDEGRTLSTQELRGLNNRLKALEEMARIEDRFKRLEGRKRHRNTEDDADQVNFPRSVTDQSPAPSDVPSVLGHYSVIRPSIETVDSDSSSTETTNRSPKRRKYSKGIKITPSYTLKTTSSLREWGDWKRDIERVFEGDPYTYQRGSQKILKAIDYLDHNLKSLWYTYSEQQGGVQKWSVFINWTRDNVHNGQNTTATLYEQLNTAKQLPDKSPVQFNAYLAAIERDLPQQEEAASAMIFYSKLSNDLKRQFKTSDIPIPNTRAKCVAVAQRIWEGLNPATSKSSPTSSKYPSTGSARDRKDRYRLSHRSQEHRNQERPKDNHVGIAEEKPLTCFKCKKSGHYASNCPERISTKTSMKPRVQSAQQEYYSASPQPSSRASTEPPQIQSDSEIPQTQSDSETSSESLN